MNGRERVALAMRNEIPDRVPVMCQLALGHYFLNTAIPPHRIWFTSEGFAEALATLQRRYRFDGILINIPGRPKYSLDSLLSLEETADGEILSWAEGGTTVIPPDDNAQHRAADDSKPQRADFDAFDAACLDAVDDYVGYVWNIYHIPWIAEKADKGPLSTVPAYFFRTIDLVRQAAGDEVSVHGEVFSPFTHFVELFGYQHALMDILIDAVKAHSILERLTEASVAWAAAQAHYGVDAVLISSAFAGGPFLSPKLYEEFVVPYERRVTEAVRAAGVPVYTHTCGSIGDRLELMLETGTQGIDTLDPPPLGNADLGEAKKRIGGKAFIKGNMNAVELLSMKMEDEVIAHASERIRAGMPRGGYILSTACSVAPRTEPWKLELLVPLSESIGRY